MSAHLLPVSAAWLARLPDHTPILVRHGEITFACCVLSTDAEGRVVLPIGGYDPDLERLPASCALDLTDTVTAAAVAARVVGPWLDTDPDRRVDVPCGMSMARSIADAAVWMEPLTPDQFETLARLARAAMEEG